MLSTEFTQENFYTTIMKRVNYEISRFWIGLFIFAEYCIISYQE
jgi:hypothetical protein